MAEKPNPFIKMLRAGTPKNTISALKEVFDSINKVLSDACELAFKKATPGKLLDLMTVASFKITGSTLVFEDNPDRKKNNQSGKCTPP